MQDLKVLGDGLVASSAVASVQSPEGIPDTSTGAQQPAAESSKDADKNQGEVDAKDIKDGSDVAEKKSSSSGSYDGRTNFSGCPEKLRIRQDRKLIAVTLQELITKGAMHTATLMRSLEKLMSLVEMIAVLEGVLLTDNVASLDEIRGKLNAS